MRNSKTYLHPFQDELVYYPKKNGKECEFCGLSSIAHKHKPGALPKDYERIEDEPMSNSTQNKYKTMDDYEKELKKKGIYTKPKIKRDKAEDIVFGWMFECDRSLDKQSRKMLTDEIRLALADARMQEYWKGVAVGKSEATEFHKNACADARKEDYANRMFTIESMKKCCEICGVIKETAFHTDASKSHDGCENNYNEAIDDVLATLREEEGGK